MPKPRDACAEPTWSAAPPHVVVADADGDERSMLVGALERDGYRVTAVCDAGRLLELTCSPRTSPTVDLVVADVGMPILSGLDALDALRASATRAPWLLTTVTNGDDLLDQARAFGAVGVLRKPFDACDFCLAVRVLLEHRRRTRRRRHRNRPALEA